MLFPVRDWPLVEFWADPDGSDVQQGTRYMMMMMMMTHIHKYSARIHIFIDQLAGKKLVVYHF